MLHWAEEQGYVVTGSKPQIILAIAGGDVTVVEYVVGKCKTTEWKNFACTEAAKSGQLSVLQWARSPGDFFHTLWNICRRVRWQNCPWDEWTCAYAALHGHLTLLQWARSKGCPWDYSTYIYAAMRGHVEVVQWALDNGCPRC